MSDIQTGWLRLDRERWHEHIVRHVPWRVYLEMYEAHNERIRICMPSQCLHQSLTQYWSFLYLRRCKQISQMGSASRLPLPGYKYHRPDVRPCREGRHERILLDGSLKFGYLTARVLGSPTVKPYFHHAGILGVVSKVAFCNFLMRDLSTEPPLYPQTNS